MKGTSIVTSKTVSANNYFGTLDTTVFKAGTYDAYVKVSYGTNHVQDFNFRLYFPSVMTITRKDYTTDVAA
jgi:hypothetical protein